MEDMSIKTVMDRPAMVHFKNPQNVKGELRYSNFQDAGAEFPELIMLEDFLNGFLAGSSFAGSSQCQSTMQAIVFYGFEMINNREVYKPSQFMKFGIAFTKLQEKNSLFYA